MSKYDEYRMLVKASEEVTKRMVEAGELSPEDGELRDALRQEEILEEMDW